MKHVPNSTALNVLKYYIIEEDALDLDDLKSKLGNGILAVYIEIPPYSASLTIKFMI